MAELIVDVLTSAEHSLITYAVVFRASKNREKTRKVIASNCIKEIIVILMGLTIALANSYMSNTNRFLIYRRMVICRSRALGASQAA